MSEADEINKSIRLSKKYQLYDTTEHDSLIAGYNSLQELKRDMFGMINENEISEAKTDIEKRELFYAWSSLKSMNGSSFNTWLKESLGYRYEKNKDY